MRELPFWILGLAMTAIGLASQAVEAAPWVSFDNSVITPCNPPQAHPLGTAYEVTWADNCTDWERFYNPRLRTDFVEANGSVLFRGFGPLAIRQDSRETSDGRIGFGPTDSLMFLSGGWGYIYDGPQIGGAEGDRYIRWVGPPAAGVASNAVRNPTGEELLKEGLVTRRGTQTQQPADPCSPCGQPAPVSGTTLTREQVQSWCSGDCPIWRFSQLVEGNGFVNPRGVKMGGGNYVTLNLPAGVSADTPGGRVFGPTTCWVNEASVRLN